jgi:hypothetical protein
MFLIKCNGKLITDRSSFVNAKKIARVESMIRADEVSVYSDKDMSKPFAVFVCGGRYDQEDTEAYKIG